jgi:hypothetical protein
MGSNRSRTLHFRPGGVGRRSSTTAFTARVSGADLLGCDPARAQRQYIGTWCRHYHRRRLEQHRVAGAPPDTGGSTRVLELSWHRPYTPSRDAPGVYWGRRSYCPDSRLLGRVSQAAPQKERVAGIPPGWSAGFRVLCCDRRDISSALRCEARHGAATTGPLSARRFVVEKCSCRSG